LLKSNPKKDKKKQNARTEVMLRKAVADDRRSASLLADPEIFVADTGASTHSTGNSKGMTNYRDAKGAKAQVGNGERVATKAIADMPFKTADGAVGNLGNIHLIPGSPFNLISGTKLLSLGFKMVGNDQGIGYTKGNQKLVFNIKIHTPEGMLFAT
jgi:hypothetical protein